MAPTGAGHALQQIGCNEFLTETGCIPMADVNCRGQFPKALCGIFLAI
jgi:hypothetical protein